jgi:DNA-binding response OmpR family regulator
MRVLVIEDDFSVASVMRHVFERDGNECVIASDGAEGLRLVSTWQPDLVLLDMNLPDADGRDILRQIRTHDSLPLIVVSGRAEEMDRVLGLEMGSDDYIVKPFSHAELLARARAVFRRTRAPKAASPDTLAHLDLSLNVGQRRLRRGPDDIALTKREFEVMRTLLNEPGELVTRENLARDIWGMSPRTASRSIDVCISTIRGKLGDDSKTPRYIETVHGVGYRLAASPPERTSLKALVFEATA